MSPDLAARRVIMSSYLYYERGVNILTDSEFDDLCFDVVQQWEDLPAIRVWMLLYDPDRLMTTGSGLIINDRAVSGAIAWYEHETGQRLPRDHGDFDLYHKGFKVKYRKIMG